MELREALRRIEYVENKQNRMEANMQSELKAIRESTEEISKAVTSIAITFSEFKAGMNEFARVKPQIEKIAVLESEMNNIKAIQNRKFAWLGDWTFWLTTSMFVISAYLWTHWSILTINNR